MTDIVLLQTSLQMLDSMPCSFKEGSSEPISAAPLHYFIYLHRLSFKSRWNAAMLAKRINGELSSEAVPLILAFLDRHEQETHPRKFAIVFLFDELFWGDGLLFTAEGLALRARLYDWLLEGGFVLDTLKQGIEWQILGAILVQAAEKMTRAVRIGGAGVGGAFKLEYLRGDDWVYNGQLPDENKRSLFGAILLASTFAPGKLVHFLSLDLPPRYQVQNFRWLETGMWEVTFGV